MDSKKIVRRLIVGSDAIDRMKREINFVVGTVIGLVLKKHEVECWVGEFSKKDRMEQFFSPEFQGYEWRLVVTGDTPRKDVLHPFEVSCHLNIGFGLGEAKVLTRSYGNIDISHWHIQRVHESLPLFVEGMKKTFPFLEDYWQSFLDAADYSEKNGW